MFVQYVIVLDERVYTVCFLLVVVNEVLFVAFEFGCTRLQYSTVLSGCLCVNLSVGLEQLIWGTLICNHLLRLVWINHSEFFSVCGKLYMRKNRDTITHAHAYAYPFLSLCRRAVTAGQFKSRGVIDCVMTFPLHRYEMTSWGGLQTAGVSRSQLGVHTHQKSVGKLKHLADKTLFSGFEWSLHVMVQLIKTQHISL